MAESALHARTSSFTKCRRLSSRLFPSFVVTAAVLRPFDGGRAETGSWYQLGAKGPPSAATRPGPTWCKAPLHRYCSVGAGGGLARAAAAASGRSFFSLI